jgi:hypothetical protein
MENFHSMQGQTFPCVLYTTFFQVKLRNHSSVKTGSSEGFHDRQAPPFFPTLINLIRFFICPFQFTNKVEFIINEKFYICNSFPRLPEV